MLVALRYGTDIEIEAGEIIDEQDGTRFVRAVRETDDTHKGIIVVERNGREIETYATDERVTVEVR